MRFDRVLMGHDGKLFEVFDPPWWRLDRWFRYFFLSRKHAKAKVQIVVNDVTYTVRARSASATDPRPDLTARLY